MERRDIELPKDDREMLIAPPARELAGLVRANGELIGGYDFPLAGRPVGEFRAAVREEVIAAARAYTASLGVTAPSWAGGPIVQTGHQPEFYHPGVWVKNHVAARLATTVDGVALNLVVDNDVPREGELTFPVRTQGGFARHHVRFAEVDSSRAYEEHTDKESWCFGRLAHEVRERLPIDDPDPVIVEFAHDAARCTAEARDIAHLMTLFRRRYEEAIGLQNLEIPASLLSDTPGFMLFVLALAACAGRFAGLYNGAVAEYRRLSGIRGRSRPVRDLGVEEGRVELPFWVWSPGGERQRLWVASGRDTAFLIDTEEIFKVDGPTWEGIVEGRREVFDETAARMLAEGKGVFKIRPRAISNTMFCRMFLSDVFIHGVGGAKYETITDEIIRGFFGVEPPAFIASSATLFLPIDVEEARREEVRRLRWDLRDARYNPERHMDAKLRKSGRVAELVGEKCELVRENETLRGRGREARRAAVRRQRRGIFTDIRRHNAELGELIDGWVAGLRKQIARLEQHVGDREVVRDRGYAFVLYPQKHLLDFYDEKIDMP